MSHWHKDPINNLDHKYIEVLFRERLHDKFTDKVICELFKLTETSTEDYVGYDSMHSPYKIRHSGDLPTKFWWRPRVDPEQQLKELDDNNPDKEQ